MDERYRHTETTVDALTPELVDELDRKTAAGESLTEAEGLLWAAAVEASKPEFRGHVDEDGLWQMDDDCERELSEWYERPIAETLFGQLPTRPPTPTRLPPPVCRAVRRMRPTRPSRRVVRGRRAQAARAQPRESDDDPDDLAAPRLEIVVPLEGAVGFRVVAESAAAPWRLLLWLSRPQTRARLVETIDGALERLPERMAA